MTARPSSNLDWGGTQTEPSSGAKALGYAPGDRPTAQNSNWLLSNTDLWIKFLRDVFGDIVAQAGFTFDGDSTQFARAFALSKESSAYLNPRTVAAGTALNSLAANRQLLVAVGQAGEIVSSDDLGETWATDTAGGGYSGDFKTAHWYDDGALFVIAGTAGEIQTSPDASTWTHRATSAGVSPRAMASRGAQIVVVGGHSGTGGTRAWSSNGTTWSSNAATIGAGFVFYDVAAAQAGAAVFVAVGYGGGATRANFVHRSTNGGASFTPVDLSSVLAPDEIVEQVVWHESFGFVGLVFDTSLGIYTCVISSSDGLTWVKKGAAAFSAMANGSSANLVATVGGLMLVSAASAFPTAVSLDGQTWVQLPFTRPHGGSQVDGVRFARFSGCNAYAMMWPENANVHIAGPWAL